MFGIDFSEILVIFGIALVVLGPEKLPKLANTIGRWIGRARAMARQFKDQLEQETGSLHRGMDLGPEFTGRPAPHSATNTPATRPVAPSHTPTTAEPAPTEQTIAVDNFGLADTYPAAFSSPAASAAQSAAGHAAPPTAVGSGPAAADGNPIPANGSGAATPSVTATDAHSPAAAAPTSHPLEPHQQSLWPPDGPS